MKGSARRQGYFQGNRRDHTASSCWNGISAAKSISKSVYDNVAYGPRIAGIKKKSQLDEIVERSLRQAAIWDELKDRLNKSALGLSGGQQQRLCIAEHWQLSPK